MFHELALESRGPGCPRNRISALLLVSDAQRHRLLVAPWPPAPGTPRTPCRCTGAAPLAATPRWPVSGRMDGARLMKHPG